MPEDVSGCRFAGPAITGKTNILLHMLYKLLEFDKIFLYSKNLHQNKYQSLLDDFTDNIDPQVGYQVIEAPGAVMTSSRWRSCPRTTKNRRLRRSGLRQKP